MSSPLLPPGVDPDDDDDPFNFSVAKPKVQKDAQEDIMANLELEEVSDEDISLGEMSDDGSVGGNKKRTLGKGEKGNNDSDSSGEVPEISEAVSVAPIPLPNARGYLREGQPSYQKDEMKLEDENASDEGEIKSDSEEDNIKPNSASNSRNSAKKLNQPPSSLPREEDKKDKKQEGDDDDNEQEEEEKMKRLAAKKPIEFVNFGEAEKRARNSRTLYNEPQDRWRSSNVTPAGYRPGYMNMHWQAPT